MDRATFIVCRVFLTLSIFSFALSAQTPSQPKPEGATIITSVDEVSLDLIVHNKKSKPVLDLKPEDIKLTDDGIPVKITDLRLVNGATDEDHRITLLFDRLEPSAAKNARNIASKILRLVPADGFSFSVMNIAGRLRLYRQFTSDREALGKAVLAASEIDQANPVNESALPEKNLIAVAQTGVDSTGAAVSENERVIARITLATLEDSQRVSQDQNAQPPLAGLMALARIQRQIPGRKVVIYFEQGLQLDSNAKDLLRSIAGAANRSGVSIYVVDANALNMEATQGLISAMAIGGMAAAGRMNAPAPATSVNTQIGANGIPGMASRGSDQMGRFETEGLAGHKSPLGELATNTGGIFIGGSDSVKKPLQQLLQDMTSYYTASYVPPIEEYDGRFRPVIVKPVRSGLKIRSRSGYFALPPGSGSEIHSFEAPLLKALREKELPSDLKFRSQVVRLGELPEGNASALIVEVPISNLEARQDPNANLYAVHLSMVAQIKNKAGAVLEHFSEDVPRHGALESMEAGRQEAITLQRPFIAAPGEYILESAILDRNSGKISAQRKHFEIQKVAAGASLSDLTIVRRTEPISAETDLVEPLRYQNIKVIPNLSGEIAPQTKDISFFFMVHPDTHAAEYARLEMEILRNGESIGRVPLQLRKTSGQGAVPYLASLRANSLQGGAYQATAMLTQDGKTSASSISFKIDGPELASNVPIATNSVTDSASNGNFQSSGAETRNGHRLVITAMPSDDVGEPSAEQVQTLVDAARARANGYSASLPNFSCVEITNRSTDSAGNGKWKHKDSIVELLRYRDARETRVTLAVNGQRSNSRRNEFQGFMSEGEFGGVLNAVFRPESKAEFRWKETDALAGGTVQVLRYRVARENSSFTLSDHTNQQIDVAFHGLVYVDEATKGVRRITIEAGDVPSDFSIRSTTIAVDYDYVGFGGHDYLMPIRGTVSTKHGKRKAVLNEIEFRDYRRYLSTTKVLFEEQNPQ
jgi:VWFA-related protein